MNKAILIGNLTRDPEVRTTGSGTTVCTFTIAVNRRFQNQAGERVSDFFNIVAWRQLGELCGKYLSKGRKVSVIGEIQNRSYDAKDGSKRYITEIIADEIEFLTPKGQEGGSGSGGKGFREHVLNLLTGPDIPVRYIVIDHILLPFRPSCRIL